MTITFKKDDGTARKNLYHSHLVRACSGGGLMLKVKSVLESKYPKDNCSHVAWLAFPDDETEYAVAVENEILDAFERAPRDVWIMAQAGGSANTPATITFTQAEGVSVPVADSDAPPPLWPDDAPTPTAPVSPKGDAVAVAVANTVRAVGELAAQGIDVDPTPIYSTHFIQASR